MVVRFVPDSLYWKPQQTIAGFQFDQFGSLTELSEAFVTDSLLQSESVIGSGIVSDDDGDGWSSGPVGFRICSDKLVMVSIQSYITIDSVDTVSDRELRSFILGIGMRTLCHLRGYLVLHGSCVRIDGTAFTFVGPSQVGKSTLAAAFYDQGYDVVADDVTVVDPRQGTVRPAFPGVKLSRSAAEAFSSFDTIDEANDSKEARRYYRVPDGFPDEDVELGGIYVLTDDADVPGTELKPGAAMHELSRATFDPFDEAERPESARLFQQQASLVESVPVRAVTFPDSLDRLPEAVERIAADIA